MIDGKFCKTLPAWNVIDINRMVYIFLKEKKHPLIK